MYNLFERVPASAKCVAGCRCDCWRLIVMCMQVFDEELAEVEQRVRLIAAAGADAVIVQVRTHELLAVRQQR